MTPQEIAVLRDKSASRRTEWQRLNTDGRQAFAMLHVEPLMGDVELLVAECDRLRTALQACMDYIPGSDVRSWPPGHALKRTAIEKSRAALEGRNPTND